jgi:preprotein translocase subunit YajC
VKKEFEHFGDKIVTKSGLHGKFELADTTVVIETMAEN